MEHIQQDKILKSEAVTNYVEFFLLKSDIDSQIGNTTLTAETTISILDLQNKFPAIDWLKAINKQLLKYSRVVENDKIMVLQPQYFEKLYEGAIGFNKA